MPSRPPSRCTSCGTRRDPRGRCPACRPASTTKAAETKATWRWVYDDPRWAPLRDQVLSEEALCRTGCGHPPTVVDHIRPHRGDQLLAFDRANLQAMCKSCHDSKTSYETGFAGLGTKRLTQAVVTLVCGPPCSGKTTYVRDRAQGGDLVVDWDALAQALGSPHPWDHPAPLTPFIAEARDAVTARLAR
ncbi:HNH endonuclease, partial [Streptomyces nitrosporeus]